MGKLNSNDRYYLLYNIIAKPYKARWENAGMTSMIPIQNLAWKIYDVEQFVKAIEELLKSTGVQ